jgi:phosphinothricin acetyltransferase
MLRLRTGVFPEPREDRCANMNQEPSTLSAADLHAVEIGPAGEGDLPAIVAILNYTIANSDATFTSKPVTLAERRDWFEQFSPSGPHRLLVARRGDQILGYAASQPYRDHDGFRETVEVSIALEVSSRGHGIGTALYRALFGFLAGEPVHVALAGIVLPNDASVALHRKFGFNEVGTFHEYGIKNGRYLSSLWMERLRPA